MGPYLSVECDGTRLTLGADPLWPGRVALATRLDLTADVLQSCELASAGHQHSVTNCTRIYEFQPFKKKKIIKQLPTCQLHQSACEGMRGMTCASLVGQDGSGSLRQKADKSIEKLNNPLS